MVTPVGTRSKLCIFVTKYESAKLRYFRLAEQWYSHGSTRKIYHVCVVSDCRHYHTEVVPLPKLKIKVLSQKTASVFCCTNSYSP